MDDINESLLVGYPNVISYKCTKKILEQMGKTICKFKLGSSQGTAFFCKIPFNNKNDMIPVFITNNHLIGNELLYKKNLIIDFYIEEEKEPKKLNLNNRMKYTNEKADITIIELKKEDNIQNFLELDDIIIDDILDNDNRYNKFIDKTIYIIQYPEGELSVSYGILSSISKDNKIDFIHKCSTKHGSSGSPILTLNNKIIGIHKQGGNNNNLNKGAFLNNSIKEFINMNKENNKRNEMILKEFNIKHSLDIKDNKVEKLDLKNKNLSNKDLKEFCKIEFKELKDLYLGYNNLSDINILEKLKFEKIDNLNLRSNKIQDINVLSKITFKELKRISFYENNILNIDILSKVNFEKLEHLNLGKNEISNINALEKVNCKDLKRLYLDDNKISDIKVLEKVPFKNLIELSLGENKISDINVFEKANFKELKVLYLHSNKISDINVFEKDIFEKLDALSLYQNDIDLIINEPIISKLKSQIKNVCY